MSNSFCVQHGPRFTVVFSAGGRTPGMLPAGTPGPACLVGQAWLILLVNL